MRMIRFVCAMVMLSFLSVSMVQAQSVMPQDRTVFETPCQVDMHPGDQACAYRVVTLGVGNPVRHVTFNPNYAVPLKTKYKTFTLFYIFSATKKADGTMVSMDNGDQDVMLTIPAGPPVTIWSSTSDGGRHWSRLHSTQRDAMGL